MICRDAAAADIDWLAETTLANYAQVFAPLLPECDWAMFDAQFLHLRFVRDWPQVRIVAEAGGTKAPLGFANVSGAHIDMFFVARVHQSQGAGSVLLADAEARGARTLDCFALNLDARRFYERHGWRLYGASRRRFAGAECDFVNYEKV